MISTYNICANVCTRNALLAREHTDTLPLLEYLNSLVYLYETAELLGVTFFAFRMVKFKYASNRSG